jgi:hypothetical protein
MSYFNKGEKTSARRILAEYLEDGESKEDL